MRKLVGFVLSAFLCVFSACTEPGETTGLGATAGGVMGAGLGAIVGSQTGSAGTGLVIGAAAGAATGAAVGNALEAQQQALRNQDEAIERQEKLMQAQKKEIAELRSMGGDNTVRQDYSRSRLSTQSEPMRRSAAKVTSKTLVDETSSYAENRGYDRDRVVRKDSVSAVAEALHEDRQADPRNFDGSEERARMNSSQFTSDDCRKADDEASQASRLPEMSERLFHYRRALRLCPDNPKFHNGLGEVYRALKRETDARFEFQEALRLDPRFAAAQNNLDTLKK